MMMFWISLGCRMRTMPRHRVMSYKELCLGVQLWVGLISWSMAATMTGVCRMPIIRTEAVLIGVIGALIPETVRWGICFTTILTVLQGHFVGHLL